MNLFLKTCVFFVFLSTASTVFASSVRRISETQLKDSIHGYWIGQLAGNYIGFPFENLYVEEPIPILVNRYFDYRDQARFDLNMNLNDRRAFTRIMADAMGGAWSDDDTDIEFVTLHALEIYGLDLTYEELTQEWIAHVNRFIWSANRRARDLMETGMVPPATGSREHNDYWYRITSQLTNEIWGVLYPGMVDKAAERSEWGARVTTEDWATHPDIVYGVMYSAAFFESDIKDLVQLGRNHLPIDSPFRRGIDDLLYWHSEHEDWRVTRQLLHENYFEEIDGFFVPYPVVGSIINGLSGIMALLYGNGDFTRTVAIATSAGYDCDNQAATCGGLLGVMNGASSIPDSFTKLLPSRGEWKEPFNNQYINYSRDGLPNYNKISDIVERLLALVDQSILGNGGSCFRTGEIVYYEVLAEGL